MKKHGTKLYFIFALSMVFLLSSCLKDNETSPIPMGGMLTVNAFNESNSVVFYANDMPLSNRGLKFKEVSANYYTFPIGSQQLAVRSLDNNSEGSQSYLASQNLIIKDSTLYTALIFGNLEKPKLGIVEDHGIDNLTINQSGVRFFNLTNNTTSPVSLEIGEGNRNDYWTDREPNKPSNLADFQEFEAVQNGKYDLIVKDKSGKELAIRTELSLDPQKYYTIVFLEDNKDFVFSIRPDGKNNFNKSNDVVDSPVPYYIGVIQH